MQDFWDELIEKDEDKARRLVLSMFKYFKLKKSQKVKKNSTSIERCEIVFKPGAIELIKQATGIKTDAELARRLNLTRSYVCLLKSQKASCTQTVICRVAALLNIIDGPWWTHFELIRCGPMEPNSPLWNNEKYKGMSPYTKYSPSKIIRDLDYNAE